MRDVSRHQTPPSVIASPHPTSDGAGFTPLHHHAPLRPPETAAAPHCAREAVRSARYSSRRMRESATRSTVGRARSCGNGSRRSVELRGGLQAKVDTPLFFHLSPSTCYAFHHTRLCFRIDSARGGGCGKGRSVSRGALPVRPPLRPSTYPYPSPSPTLPVSLSLTLYPSPYPVLPLSPSLTPYTLSSPPLAPTPGAA